MNFFGNRISIVTLLFLIVHRPHKSDGQHKKFSRVILTPQRNSRVKKLLHILWYTISTQCLLKPELNGLRGMTLKENMINGLINLTLRISYILVLTIETTSGLILTLVLCIS